MWVTVRMAVDDMVRWYYAIRMTASLWRLSSSTA